MGKRENMIAHNTSLSGVHVLEPKRVEDNRGSFARVFCARELSYILGKRRIVQINHSLTREKGTIRGLHYQLPPVMEVKLVRCLVGAVWDVALDLRVGSPTFLQCFAMELTPANMKTLVIPEGCAHGFQTLEPNTEVVYLHTEFYNPRNEGGVRFDDPRISMTWPLAVADISIRDNAHPFLSLDFKGISV